MRHKTWMLALSVLGNILALPVAYLLSVSASDGREGAAFEGDLSAVEVLHDLFCGELCVSAGAVAVIMAVLVGFAGFRYLFHRNMVDVYHGIPVRRRTLFLVNWLNGLLIWLVPFTVCTSITILLGEVRLSRLRAALPVIFHSGMPESCQEELLSGSVLFLEMLETAAVVMIAFLVVYHLILVAVMLCGNVLNAICVALVLGGGVFSCFSMGILLCQLHFDTYMGTARGGQEFSIYASPLFSIASVLMCRIMGREEMGHSAISPLVELLTALVLGMAAAFLYQRRPSELAEQGLKNKPVRCLIRTAVGVTAGMGGWDLFQLLTAEISGGRTRGAVGWSVFGCVLASVTAFGVMDMIFHMDLKTFFAHKAAMAATVAVTLGVCFSFLFDWFGYDTRLPGQEQIAEISLGSSRYNNRYYEDPEADENILNRVHLTDQQAVCDFLQAAVRVQRGEVTGTQTETFQVKVTLENGREYYRSYQICDTESGETYALLVSPEYQSEAYRISEKAMGSFTSFSIGRGEKRSSGEQTPELLGDAQFRAVVREICEAYNTDIRANPGVTVKGDGILLCEVRLSVGEDSRGCFYLDVYDTMGNTVEALKKYGFSDFAEACEAEDIGEITLRMWLDEEPPGDDPGEAAEAVYGAGSVNGRHTRSGIGYEASVSVTDPEEVAELLEIICYRERRNGTGIFYPGLAGYVDLTDKDGAAFEAYMPKGALPEKFVRRFLETED